VARWLVAQAGLDPDRDLRVAQIGPPPALRAALENRQIDGFVLSPPEGLLAEQAGSGHILVRLGDEFAALRAIPYLVLVAKRPLAPEKQEVLVTAIRALERASVETVRNPSLVADAIQRRFFAQLPADLIARAVDAMKDGVAGQGRLSAPQLATLMQVMGAAGGLPANALDPASGEGEFWTNDLIEAALR
jgi:ABC-type nitrate/sulfonate/bicarbonate transport system substrate-binding protein